MCRRSPSSTRKIFPLVATRPPAAPWLRPPLRSLRWVEAFLEGLTHYGFDKESNVVIYRSFSTFLLGHLLLQVATSGNEPSVSAEDDIEFFESNDLNNYPRLDGAVRRAVPGRLRQRVRGLAGGPDQPDPDAPALSERSMDGVQIGTSGWSYDHWENVLYPPGLPARDRLARYVAAFSTVELNASFYRWPKTPPSPPGDAGCPRGSR